jgi:hypothetical protein
VRELRARSSKYANLKNEKGVKRCIIEILNKHKYFHWAVPMNGYGNSGISDRHAVRGGVFMVIEAKFGSNKPTPLQKGFLTSINAESCFAFCVNENNLDSFQAFHEAFDRATIARSKKEKIAPEDGAMMANAIIELTNMFNKVVGEK